MSGHLLFNECEQLNALQPSDSFDDGFGYLNTDYSNWQQQLTQEECLAPRSMAPEFTAPGGYYDAHTLPGEHSSHINRDMHPTRDNAQAPIPLQQPHFGQAYYAPDPPPAYTEQRSVHAPLEASHASDPFHGNPQTAWPEMSPANHEPFYGTLYDPRNHFPAPQSIAPVVYPAPFPIAGPALNTSQLEPEANGSQAHIPQKTRPRKQCSICKKDFDPKPSNWDRHQNTHTQTMGYECANCGAQRVTRDQVVVHYVRYHMGVPAAQMSKEQRAEAHRHVVLL